jgi:hypothetical protein
LAGSGELANGMAMLPYFLAQNPFSKERQPKSKTFLKFNS